MTNASEYPYLHTYTTRIHAPHNFQISQSRIFQFLLYFGLKLFIKFKYFVAVITSPQSFYFSLLLFFLTGPSVASKHRVLSSMTVTILTVELIAEDWCPLQSKCYILCS